MDELEEASGNWSSKYESAAAETNIFNPEELGIAETGEEQIRGLIDVSAHPHIGPYKLLEEIGHGGMGAVYMAQQTQPIKRKVALKVIKPGMDTREVIARFEAKRQALEKMPGHAVPPGYQRTAQRFSIMGERDLVKSILRAVFLIAWTPGHHWYVQHHLAAC